MLPNNLTALDFEDIKSSIKTYLRTREEFLDYDFEGSGLSYLIDVLSYNTYYSSFMANMSMNEAFLSSSTVRDNVVNIAKLLSYTPTSIKCSKACVSLKVQTQQTGESYPNNITLQKGPIATGGNRTWNALSPVTVEVDQTTGIAEFLAVTLNQGSIITFSYLVDNFAKQRYVIPAESADMETLSVTVRPNESSTIKDTYNLVSNITEVKSTNRVYFLSETEDERYEVTFGDGTIGRKLIDGEVIEFEYLVTEGSIANDTSVFTFIGKFIDSNTVNYAPSAAKLTVKEKAQFGSEAETIESVKFNAPRYYAAQNRAVTTQDYETIVKRLYSNAKTVAAYGGDELNPPIYGKVYIAIKTKTGSSLNDATKTSLKTQLRSYAMASIEPVIVDTNTLYIYPRIFASYDPSTASRDVSNITSNIQDAVNQYAQQSEINNFNNNFSLSKFQKAVTSSDPNVADTSTQISLVQYVKATGNQSNTYCVSTGSPLLDSAPNLTLTTGSGTTESENTEVDVTITTTINEACKKEPVIKSGKFRLADRPGIDQYFEDDGFGNLVIYYISGNRKVITNPKGGTVDYNSGTICFGPVNIVGSGGDVPDVNVDGEIDSPELIVGTDFNIAIQSIPSNPSIIYTPDPGSIIEIIVPTISVSPLGTNLPPTIPLNSLTPEIFEIVPPIIEIPDISNNGNLANISCFNS
jgi:hypothetical protein